MQLKKFYPQISILGIATVMALSACGDDNTQIPLPSDPGSEIRDSIPNNNPQPGTDSIPAIDTTSTDTSKTLPPTELPAEGPITLPQGLGVLVDDFEDANHESKIGDFWYTYDDKDNGGASSIVTPLNDDGDNMPGRVNNGSNYALQVNYTLDRGEYEYDPYVGWGLQITEDSANGRFGGITYWYKGGAHEVHIEVSDVKDYDVHLAKVPAQSAGIALLETGCHPLQGSCPGRLGRRSCLRRQASQGHQLPGKRQQEQGHDRLPLHRQHLSARHL